MGKASKKVSNTSDDEGMDALLSSMKIAQAVQHNDIEAMASMLQDCLPQASSVQSVTITKSLGESFTGGRSTPVYHISCEVLREGKPPKKRCFIVKLVLMPGEDAAMLRRRESYAVERRFYGAIAERIRDSGLVIPKLLTSDLDGSRPWPAFCILMNDLSVPFPEHPVFLSVDQAKRALQWVAKLHALFWGSEDGRWKRDLWERGAFWTNVVKVDRISATWVGTVRFLETKHPTYVTESTKSLGRRIQSAGIAIAQFLSSQMKSHGTLIHGDYKAANLFLSKEVTEENAGIDSVAAVDFQFAGAGICAEDVAYLLYPDARGDFFEDEKELLETYHAELVSQLILHQRGGPSSMPFVTFRRYYELSRVDMTRHWLAKGWTASTKGEARLVSELEATMNRLDGGSVLETYTEALLSFIESL